MAIPDENNEAKKKGFFKLFGNVIESNREF